MLTLQPLRLPVRQPTLVHQLLELYQSTAGLLPLLITAHPPARPSQLPALEYHPGLLPLQVLLVPLTLILAALLQPTTVSHRAPKSIQLRPRSLVSLLALALHRANPKIAASEPRLTWLALGC